MAFMIDWLTTGDNYNHWCSGDKQNGATKSVLTSQDDIDSLLPIVHD